MLRSPNCNSRPQNSQIFQLPCSRALWNILPESTHSTYTWGHLPLIWKIITSSTLFIRWNSKHLLKVVHDLRMILIIEPYWLFSQVALSQTIVICITIFVIIIIINTIMIVMKILQPSSWKFTLFGIPVWQRAQNTLNDRFWTYFIWMTVTKIKIVIFRFFDNISSEKCLNAVQRRAKTTF